MRRLPAPAPALVLALLLGISACGSGDLARDDSGALTESGTLSPEKLRVGDCANDPLGGSGDAVDSVSVLPCSEPHNAEVYALPELPAGEYPGDEQVKELGNEACAGAFEAYIGVDFQDSKYDGNALYPSKESYADDRTATCFVQPANGEKVTGTLKGTNN